MDDLEATQTSFKSPRTQEELDALLESMGADRPLNTFGATISPFLMDDAGNPVAVDRKGNPINFEVNPDYDPNAKPSFENFKNKIPGMVEGVKQAASDPLAAIQDTVQSAGEGLYEYGKGFTERLQTGQNTLGDVFDVIGSMIGAGPATSVATKGVRGTLTDLQDTSTSRMFLTPGTKNMTPDVQGGLQVAKDLELQGVDPLAIKQQTGWENLAGKEWVYEIDDSQANTLSSARVNNASITQEFKVPGGKISGNQRQKLILAAQRDIIELQKQLRNGSLSQDEFDTLAASRQRALDNEVNYVAEDRVISKNIPLKNILREKGTLKDTFYHPEIGNYVDTEAYTVDTNATKPKAEKIKPGVQGDYSPGLKRVRIFKNVNPNDVLPTMVHEGQHFLDGASGSPGTGFNAKASSGIRAKAADRFSKTFQDFVDTKVEKTVDDLNIAHFGPELTYYEFADLINESIGTRPDGSKIFSEDFFKEALKVRGNSNPDTTVALLKESFPGTWKNIEEAGDIFTSRDASLAAMTDDLRIYETELGEIKARLAANRLGYSPDKRRNTLATPEIKYSGGLPINLNAIFTTKDFE